MRGSLPSHGAPCNDAVSIPAVNERGTRRLSLAISEGDGISVLVEVAAPEAAGAAEEQGADGIVVRTASTTVREATDLPILWCPDGPDPDAPEIDHVLELLPDVPAGKLAVAFLADATREDVEALERAGVDAVVVNASDVRELVGAEPPTV